ncbi:MAG TPA: FAD-dependent oxidoreductase, partial [Pseudonocardia sp.]|nr:FAD-dependent oxidoreductase [Pseudonocardia sp.]
MCAATAAASLAGVSTLPDVTHDVPGYDVLIVGAGPGGLATALSAARHGARVLVVDRHPGTSTRPRATGIGLRTMEIFRVWGVADAVRERAVPVDVHASSGATLVAPPRSSGRAGGYPPLREILRVSPAVPLVCPQDLVEPVLADAVRRHGGQIRFGARLVGLQVRPDGVRAELATGERVGARFVVGADGTRSTVRAALGIGLRQLGTWAQAVQVLFRPDLAPLLGRDGVVRLPHLLTLVEQPQPGALCPMGAGRWSYVALRFDGGRPEIPQDWTATLRAATGLPELAPEVLDVARFTLAAAVATTYRCGPGFLVGDAAHRTTPVAGIGLNTAVHDGHELGWKLAWVARGLAGQGLLDSHDAERGPVGLAAAQRSLDVEGRPTDGLASNLGHTHRSAVIAGTGRAPELRIDLAARPGERAPHVWIRHAGARVSTLDLFDGRLTLVTGEATGWARACGAFDLQVLGAGGGSTLARAYRIGPDSAVLVRPDGRVAWRCDNRCCD